MVKYKAATHVANYYLFTALYFPIYGKVSNEQTPLVSSCK